MVSLKITTIGNILLSIFYTLQNIVQYFRLREYKNMLRKKKTDMYKFAKYYIFCYSKGRIVTRFTGGYLSTKGNTPGQQTALTFHNYNENLLE